MNKKTKDIHIGILPGMADLYNRLCPDLSGDLVKTFNQEILNLKADGIKFTLGSLACTQEQVKAECKKFLKKEVDLIVIALAPYCPSGVLAPALLNIDIPILLWPTQTMFELEPENYDLSIILLNHGVHAVQDLANTLRKKNTNFGIIHGHWKQDDFKEEFVNWAKAAKTIRSIQKANPVQIGGHFEDMLDLQIGSDAFIGRLGTKHTEITLNEFYKIFEAVEDKQIEECVKDYRASFEISDDLKEDILNKAARGEVALREVMEKYKSSAFGLNFLELCNDSRIAEPLHVAGSVLMNEGLGYAAEGDWVTAAFVYAMQQVFDIASFSEIFSVGYADNRLVLKHWGEGNYAMAKEKPKLISSKFADVHNAEFAVVDFEFEPGQITLLNLNSTPDGEGQIITMTGEITKDNLSKVDGPRAVFKPDCQDVRKLLTDYAYNGGSHHLALVKDNGAVVAEKICRLAGWKYISL